MIHSNGRNWRGTKEPLDEGERGEWKPGLKLHIQKQQQQQKKKLNIQKTEIMASGPITSRQIDGEKVKTLTFYFLGFQNHCGCWLQPWNEKTLASRKESYDKLRQHIKKQRHHFADKSPYSQTYGFSSRHVQIWKLNHKKDSIKELMPSNCGAGEDSWEFLGLQGDQTSQS